MPEIWQSPKDFEHPVTWFKRPRVMACGAGGVCAGCKWEEYDLVSLVHRDNEKALKIFRDHGVLPSSVKCPYCDSECTYYEDRRLWRWTKRTPVKAKKKKSAKLRSCPFSVSDNSGTFLEQGRIEPWQLLLFINLFILKRWSHDAAVRNLRISKPTSVDWRSFCAEVCEKWVGEDRPIGGPGVVVEIDETHFVKRKFNKGRVLSSVWLLGGIERESNRTFIVPLSEPLSQTCREGQQDPDTFNTKVRAPRDNYKHWLLGCV